MIVKSFIGVFLPRIGYMYELPHEFLGCPSRLETIEFVARWVTKIGSHPNLVDVNNLADHLHSAAALFRATSPPDRTHLDDVIRYLTRRGFTAAEFELRTKRRGRPPHVELVIFALKMRDIYELGGSFLSPTRGEGWTIYDPAGTEKRTGGGNKLNLYGQFCDEWLRTFAPKHPTKFSKTIFDAVHRIFESGGAVMPKADARRWRKERDRYRRLPSGRI